MFSPKTNAFKSHKNYFTKQSEPKQPTGPIVTKSIFSKNYQDDESMENTSSIFNKNRTGLNRNNESPL